MTRDWTLTIARRAEDIAASDWAKCVAPEDTLKCRALFLAFEQSGSAGPATGWTPCHALLRQDGVIAAIAPLYLKDHSWGEFVFDQTWAEAYAQVGGQYYPKLIGCIPFTPVGSARIWVRRDHPDAARVLRHMARHIVALYQSLGLSSAHLTFCTLREAETLRQDGWLVRQGIQYHWYNENYVTFDDFLQTLTTRKRKMIRKEREKAASYGLTIEITRGTVLSESSWDEIDALYRATTARKSGHAYLTPQFFKRFVKERGDDLIIIAARSADGIVAAAVNLMSDKGLYGRYWCCAAELPALHFELCYYRAIEWAIAQKLERVEAGAQGTHKIARGYRPEYTWSVHHIAHPAFRDAVETFLIKETTALETVKDACTAHLPFRQKDNCE